MANDRLYLVDHEAREMICLAKSAGGGWHVRNPETFGHKLNEWFDLRMDQAAWGNTRKVETSLRLVNENDPEFLKIMDYETFDRDSS